MKKFSSIKWLLMFSKVVSDIGSTLPHYVHADAHTPIGQFVVLSTYYTSKYAANTFTNRIDGV